MPADVIIKTTIVTISIITTAIIHRDLSMCQTVGYIILIVSLSRLVLEP